MQTLLLLPVETRELHVKALNQRVASTFMTECIVATSKCLGLPGLISGVLSVPPHKRSAGAEDERDYVLCLLLCL